MILPNINIHVPSKKKNSQLIDFDVFACATKDCVCA